MVVLTIRTKNQVTIPELVLQQSSLRQGDPIEVTPLPDGGIAIHPRQSSPKSESLWDWAVRTAALFPGIEDIELELPERRPEEPREIEW